MRFNCLCLSPHRYEGSLLFFRSGVENKTPFVSLRKEFHNASKSKPWEFFSQKYLFSAGWTISCHLLLLLSFLLSWLAGWSVGSWPAIKRMHGYRPRCPNATCCVERRRRIAARSVDAKHAKHAKRRKHWMMMTMPSFPPHPALHASTC